MDDLPRPSPDVVFRDVEGETVLVHLGTNRIYSLNPTATRLWQLLGEGYDKPSLSRTLLQEFDVDPEALEQEINHLISHLAREDLLT
jgi:coenzyme PQQ synthesis protein D (PqqD)